MKKGSETLMFVFSVFGLVLVLFFAWFIFLVVGGEKAEQELITNSPLNTDFILLNFLKTPLKIGEDNWTISDLILDSYYRNDYKQLEEEANKILNPLYPENICFEWNLELKLMPEDKELKSIVNKNRFGSDSVKESSLEISLLDDPNKKIKVRLYEEC